MSNIMNTLTKQSIFTGAILAAIAVALGAFGAHALRPRLEQHYFDVFETAVRYHFIHSIALILFGLTAQFLTLPKLTYYFFFAGILLFSGSLYILAFGSLLENNPVRWLGAITPLGGLCFIIGWLLYAYYTIKK
jgi:uncharacterized membrane protein YgdD (TMEM256/DUF423 family)